VEVKSSCGNNTLGGKDFDQAIMDHIIGTIKKRDKIDVSGDARAMIRIKIAAEQCKIALSAETENTIELPFLYGKNGNPVGYSEKITRADFESMIREKIYSTEHQIKTALFDANLSAEDIGLTLLVGGSTRIPLVSHFLDETLRLTSESAVDPDLSVVRGAAIQAGVLSGVLNENAIVLTDVCPYSLSTEALIDTWSNEKETFCDILIKRNTTLPASVSKIYATSCDYQTKVHITAYQGESLDPDENYLLNCFELSGIPKAKAYKEKINIRFEYDLNGILTVQAEIISTGKKAAVTVNTSQMGKNLDLSKWKDVPDARKYRQIINKTERLIKVYGNENSGGIKAAVNELKKALIMNWDDAVIEKMIADLEDEIDCLEKDIKK